jgi:hypothetical protein
MSAVVIAGDTSGTVTLDAPAVAGSTVLTLPATSGTFLTSASNTNFPVGSVLQVVQVASSTETTTTSTSYVNTGLSASITPSSSSNKILILINVWSWIAAAANNGMGFQVLRGATSILNTAGNNYVFWNNGGQLYSSQAFNYLDSPSTTSSTTYTVQMASNAGGSVGINKTTVPPTSTITLMEIKG